MSGEEAVKAMDSMSHRQGKEKEERKKVINRNIPSVIKKYWIFSLGQKSSEMQTRRRSSSLQKLAAID